MRPDFLLIYGEGTFTNYMFSGAVVPLPSACGAKAAHKEDGWIICLRENHLWSAKSLSSPARDRCRRQEPGARGEAQGGRERCPERPGPALPGFTSRLAPGRGRRAPWVLGAFPLRSSCPFKSKSRERGGWGDLSGPLFPGLPH